MSCYTCVHRFLTSLPCCYSDDYAHTRLREPPTVSLDTDYIGSEAVVVKGGKRLCGSGAALGNTSISQSKAYFEVKVQQNGVWGIGLGTRKIDPNRLPLGKDGESLVLRQDSSVYCNNEVVATLPRKVEEGDCVGLAFDHDTLSFFIDGESLDCSVPAPRFRPIYPLVYVDDGAILDVHLSEVTHALPFGFHPIMIEQTIL